MMNTRLKPYLIPFFCIYTLSILLLRPAMAAEYSQEQLAFMPATQQIELFKQGKISPVDVLNAQIAQYKKTNKKVNAVTYTYFDSALMQAKIAEQRYKDKTNRPLEGITVGIKDEHYDKGWKVTQGSLIHKNDPPKDHADAIVKKLKTAGAILLLQTTVPEFYLSFTTATKAWGVTKNPWNLKYFVGGSSGGSGAALAAGYVTLATGSDMGGSVRIPSAANGIYGYKPAFGEVHSDIPLSYFSGTGPMARTFDDMVLMQNVIAGPDVYSLHVSKAKPLAMTYPSLKGMKIAYVGGMGIIKPSKEVEQAMANAIKVLEAQGATVDRVNLDIGVSPKELSALFTAVAFAGPMGGMLSTYKDRSEQLTGYAKHFVDKTQAYQKDGNKTLFESEQKIKAIYKKIADKVFSQGYDVMIMPTLPTSQIPAAFDLSKDKLIVDGVEYPSLVGGLYTIPFNLLNWMPVISVPIALGPQNMPIGMQIIGKPSHNEDIFRVAYNYSQKGIQLFRGKLMPKEK
jgi:amidase